jgi:hypothetical protein
LWTFPRLRTFQELLFKFQGPNREIRDCGLIFETPRGFFAKLSGIIDFGIIFPKKTRGPRGPVYHGPFVDGWPELTGAWPLAASVLKGASQGAEDGKTGLGNLLRASSEGGRWRGGRATEGTAAVVGVPVRGSLELRERRRRERGGEVLSGGAPGGFYRAGEGAHAPGDGGEWAAALMAACAGYRKRGRWRWPMKEG